MTLVPNLYHPRMGIVIKATLDGTYGLDDEVSAAVIPTSAVVVRNRNREPDTFSVVAQVRAMPFDPHQLRGAGIEVYIFDAEHLTSEWEWREKQYKRIVGIVNDASIAMHDGQVSFSGMDYTGIFSTQEWDPRDKIKQGRRLDVMIQEILDTVQSQVKDSGSALNIKVVVRGDAKIPVVGKGLRARHRRALSIKQGKTVWDVAYELAEDNNFQLFIDDDEAVLQGEAVVKEGAQQVPLMAYGRNLRTLTASRKFTKDVVPQIEASGRLPNGEFAREKYPKNPARARATAGLGVQKNQISRIKFRRISSRKELRRRAFRKFDEESRGEAEYRFSTPHMQGLRGLDLLSLKAQKPIQIYWDAFNGENLRQLPVEKRAAFLEGLGYSPGVSQVIVTNLEQLLRAASQPYYCTEAEFRMDAQGFSVSVRAKNYIIEKRETSEGPVV